jgi:hypothetical protein
MVGKKDRAKGTTEEEICDVDRKTHVQITFSIDLWLEMMDGKVVSSISLTIQSELLKKNSLLDRMKRLFQKGGISFETISCFCAVTYIISIRFGYVLKSPML